MSRRTSRRTRTSPIAILIFLIAVALYTYNKQELARTPDRSSEGEYSGRCVGVTDGDTIRVMHNGYEEKVRLYGVDAPEKKQAYGAAAKKFTSGLVFGKTVTVQVRDKDRYGRTVGWVLITDKRSLNLELVKSGMAWWYRDYAASDQELARAEQEARNAKRGLWSQKRPVAPWEYRKSRR